jgi:hypothetical protein
MLLILRCDGWSAPAVGGVAGDYCVTSCPHGASTAGRSSQILLLQLRVAVSLGGWRCCFSDSSVRLSRVHCSRCSLCRGSRGHRCSCSIHHSPCSRVLRCFNRLLCSATSALLCSAIWSGWGCVPAAILGPYIATTKCDGSKCRFQEQAQEEKECGLF